jgi:hypothetical protein
MDVEPVVKIPIQLYSAGIHLVVPDENVLILSAIPSLPATFVSGLRARVATRIPLTRDETNQFPGRIFVLDACGGDPDGRRLLGSLDGDVTTVCCDRRTGREIRRMTLAAMGIGPLTAGQVILDSDPGIMEGRDV